MPIAEDLLGLAQATLDANLAGEAELRRGTSTAYYALFRLLIREATADRPLFGRVFEHGKMKAACGMIPGANPKQQKKQQKQAHEVPFEQRASADHLRIVAKAFIQTQEFREFADYDMCTTWNREDLETQVLQVADAFRSWNVIRTDLEAQKFLVLLLEPKQAREPRLN